MNETRRRSRESMEGLEPRRLLSAGDPDVTFGVGGRAEREFSPGDSTQLMDSVVQADGKVVFGGYVRGPVLASRDAYVLRRLNADGTLDAGFASGGTATGNFTAAANDDSHVLAVAVAPDGRIYAVGEAGEGPVVTRFTAGGTLDPTFGGGDGVASVRPGREFVRVEVQPDGKPVVIDAGGSIRRFLTDGSPDATFGGGDGQAPNPFVNSVYTALSTMVIRFQPDGKLLVGGRSEKESFAFRAALARLNADGSVDAGFGDGGVLTDAFSSTFVGSTGDDEINDVVLLPGGGFLAAGTRRTRSDNSGGFVLARYDEDGDIDATFGASGTALIPFALANLASVVLDDDGNAILVGNRTSGLAVARVTAAGAFDEAFGRIVTEGASGRDASLPFAGSGGFASAAALDDDGRLVIAGYRQLVAIQGKRRTSSFLVRFRMQDDGAPSPVALSGTGVLSIAGTAGNDALDANETRGLVLAHRNGFGRAFDVADVGRVLVTAGDGNDQSTAALATVPASIVGGLGNDRIAGGMMNDTLEGSGGHDLIDGGGGNDLLNGGNGNDGIRGMDGDDALQGAGGADELRGGAGADVHDGVPGIDVIVDLQLPDLWLADDGVVHFVDSGNDDEQVSLWADGAGGLVAWIDGVTATVPIGRVREIHLVGNGGNDLLKLNPGLTFRSTLRGGNGNDTLIGAAATDEIYAGIGDDLLRGNAGYDAMYGEDGNDRLFGGEEMDYVDGAAGDDRIDGGPGDDRVIGGAGHDVLFGAGGADDLVGLVGNDVLLARDGAADTVNGGPGSDTAEVDDADAVLGVETRS